MNMEGDWTLYDVEEEQTAGEIVGIEEDMSSYKSPGSVTFPRSRRTVLLTFPLSLPPTFPEAAWTQCLPVQVVNEGTLRLAIPEEEGAVAQTRRHHCTIRHRQRTQHHLPEQIRDPAVEGALSGSLRGGAWPGKMAWHLQACSRARR